MVATHGRGFWILDDISPVRAINTGMDNPRAILIRPVPALRVRWNASTDMPWPKEEPVGENPPEGASINYVLAADVDSVALEIVDARGRVVRRYSSSDSVAWTIPAPAAAPYPVYWYRQPQRLQRSAGLHRFFWDVRYQPLPGIGGGGGGGGGSGGGAAGGGQPITTLPINAIARNTAPAPRAPFVAAGNYTVRLITPDTTYTEPLVVRQDPRVKTSAIAMREVYALTDSMYFTIGKLQDAADSVREARLTVTDTTLNKRLAQLLDAPVAPDSARPGPQTLRGATTALGGLLMSLQAADVAATATQRESIGEALKNANLALTRYRALLVPVRQAKQQP